MEASRGENWSWIRSGRRYRAISDITHPASTGTLNQSHRCRTALFAVLLPSLRGTRYRRSSIRREPTAVLVYRPSRLENSRTHLRRGYIYGSEWPRFDAVSEPKISPLRRHLRVYEGSETEFSSERRTLRLGEVSGAGLSPERVSIRSGAGSEASGTPDRRPVPGSAPSVVSDTEELLRGESPRSVDFSEWSYLRNGTLSTSSRSSASDSLIIRYSGKTRP